ncbi:hypothetical protein [Cedecea sp.]|jgi:hypothetical protein|uniref:hypothetical protein n=1 Tax=Cedecea sp. TaxID=1970739 RepID=UPI002F41AB71
MLLPNTKALLDIIELLLPIEYELFPDMVLGSPIAPELFPETVFPVPMLILAEPDALAPWPKAIALAPAFAPSPAANPNVPVAELPRPIAIPEIADTVDCPPIAIASFAFVCAPRVALLPIAMAPTPDAVVELAGVSGVVPFPPAPPIATELLLSARAPNPRAVLATPVAVPDNPKAEAH